MKGRTVVAEVGLLGLALLRLRLAQGAEPRAGIAAPPAGRLAERLERPRDVANQLDLRLAGGGQPARLDVQRDDLRLLSERAAEAQAEVERHADHERDVRLLQGLAACA